jgi:hypothetical protein
MEDNLLSFSCPKCGNSLFEAATTNPMFMHRSYCPFCSLPVRWARLPLTLLVSGIIFLVLGSYSLFNPTDLPAELSMLPTLAVGLGVGSFLLGIIFLRLVPLENFKEDTRSSGSYIGHAH